MKGPLSTKTAEYFLAGGSNSLTGKTSPGSGLHSPAGAPLAYGSAHDDGRL